MQNQMLLGSVIIGPFPFSVKRFLHKQSGLFRVSMRLQFKTINRVNTGEKLQDTNKIRSERDLEVYKKRILTVPNFLTISRLCISPLFPWLIINGYTKYACGLLVYCGVSDILDGWIARKFNQKSVLGSILDPVADKMTVIIFTSSLLFTGHLSFYLGALIISKDIILLMSGLILRFRSLRRNCSPIDRFFDPSVASIEIKPLLLSKINTVLQFTTLGFSIFPITIPLIFSNALQITTAVSTFITGIVHCFQHRKVVRKIIS